METTEHLSIGDDRWTIMQTGEIAKADGPTGVLRRIGKLMNIQGSVPTDVVLCVNQLFGGREAKEC